jgi:hypothetical protein
VVGLTAVILPITARNAALTGEFIPISSTKRPAPQLARALAAAGRNREARQVLDELLPGLPDGPLRRDVLALRDSLT